MKSWLITLWQIALLRAGPQNLPTGVSSPAIALMAYCAILLVSVLTDDRTAGLAEFASSVSVAIVLPLIATVAVLAARERSARFGQTVAALFGAGALISLINIPLWLSAQTPVPAPLVVLALIGLLWSLAVDGHIWRNALDCPYAVGLMVAVVIFISQLFVFQVMGNPGVS